MTKQEIRQKAEESADKIYPDLEDMSCREHYITGYIAGVNSMLVDNSPWISVEDGLPEKHTPVYAKNNTKAWFFALRTDNRQRPWYNIVGRCGEKVTHWKPIHELMKGE